MNIFFKKKDDGIDGYFVIELENFQVEFMEVDDIVDLFVIKFKVESFLGLMLEQEGIDFF